MSNWYINTDDYYPGDEYVDWVGISSYAHKYFRGDKTQPWNSQIAFKAGDSSEPVRAIQKIVETYGNRKPKCYLNSEAVTLLSRQARVCPISP